MSRNVLLTLTIHVYLATVVISFPSPSHPTHKPSNKSIKSSLRLGQVTQSPENQLKLTPVISLSTSHTSLHLTPSQEAYAAIKSLKSPSSSPAPPPSSTPPSPSVYTAADTPVVKPVSQLPDYPTLIPELRRAYHGPPLIRRSPSSILPFLLVKTLLVLGVKVLMDGLVKPVAWVGRWVQGLIWRGRGSC